MNRHSAINFGAASHLTAIIDSSRASRRRGDIEIVRVIAAFGIICFHDNGPWRAVGYAGLIFFLILTVYFAGTGTSENLFQKSKRILIPWSIWFFIYGACKIIVGKPVLDPQLGKVEAVLMGPAGHLWYLPFAFFVVCGLNLLSRCIDVRAISVVGGLLALLSLVASPLWRTPSVALGQPWAQYAHAMPAVLVGMSFLYPSFMRILGCILLASILLAAASVLDVSGVGLPYLIGISVCLALFIRPNGYELTGRILSFSRIGRYTLGIYLVHPLFLFVFSLAGMHGSWWVPIVVFCLSGLMVAGICAILPGFARHAFDYIEDRV